MITLCIIFVVQYGLIKNIKCTVTTVDQSLFAIVKNTLLATIVEPRR